MIANSNFRHDINAYRAIAVIAVLLFQFFLTHRPLGYLVVDISFVISGFLMCSIIARSFDAVDFSFRDFIEGRARKVYPALLFLIIAVLLVYWILYTIAAKLCVSTQGSRFSCRAREARDSSLFFLDYGHLTESGAYVSDLIEPAVSGAVR